MKLVRFIKAWRQYCGGDVAGFKDPAALLASGYAVLVEEEKMEAPAPSPTPAPKKKPRKKRRTKKEAAELLEKKYAGRGYGPKAKISKGDR